MASCHSNENQSEKINLPGVKHVVVVASGKGGVGKSTTSVNLALALKQKGWSVGVLDADVYGPSMGMMFGIETRLTGEPGSELVPLEAYGIKVMSMAFLVDRDTPVIWRGPMVHGILQQFLAHVRWGELDCLVIDLPPGTGDAQLSLTQSVEITGAIIVTTPQEVSIVDARKGLMMFRQLTVPVLGIVENMSYFQCPSCDARTEIFRHGGGKQSAEELDVPFLGDIPLDPEVVLGGDEGKPLMEERPESPTGKAYLRLAESVAETIKKAASETKPQQPPIMPESFKHE